MSDLGENSGKAVGASSETDPAAVAIIAISRQGTDLARTLAAALPGENHLYLDRRFLSSDLAIPPNASVKLFDLPLRPVLEELFMRYRRLTLFMPVGAAVRLLAPCLGNKRADPAVVCVDDAGRFAVSLLSGHIGGADALADQVARALGAAPIITSAAQAMDTLAVDLLGQEFSWRIEASPETITRVSAAVINGEQVGVFQETGEADWWPPNKPLPNNLKRCPSLADLSQSSSVAALVITDRLLGGNEEYKGKPDSHPAFPESLRSVIYRPKSLAVGIGCRRGVSVEHLEEFLVDVFRKRRLSLSSLACIATAELKKDEPGLLELAERYEAPVCCYPSEKLNEMFADDSGATLNRSRAAHRLLGLWGVAEPAALLASGSRELLVAREKTDQATLAVARKVFSGAAAYLLPTQRED